MHWGILELPKSAKSYQILELGRHLNLQQLTENDYFGMFMNFAILVSEVRPVCHHGAEITWVICINLWFQQRTFLSRGRKTSSQYAKLFDSSNRSVRLLEI